jgi:hypothetical protein
VIKKWEEDEEGGRVGVKTWERGEVWDYLG